jgi:hypothetical protein
MSDGPSHEEIERAREAMERHDRELGDQDDAGPQKPDEAPEDEDDEG